jgi:2-polyprenyl-3-methyl-5-hydroxy-6-metoxy-1,4-benzoquinol methylase
MAEGSGVFMNDLLVQENYYDRRWRQEGFANGLQAARCAAILAALHRIGVNQPRILDLGCGTGWLSAILGQFGPTTAIDLSDFAVGAAAKRFPWVEFRHGDVFEWSATQQPIFDVVVSQEVIEHVTDQHGYLEIVARLLKDRGYLILTTPNACTVRAMRNARSWSDQPIENVLSPDALRLLVCRRFEIIQMTTIISGFGDSGLYRLLNSDKLVRTLDLLKIREGYHRLLLHASFGLHIVVIARRR